MYISRIYIKNYRNFKDFDLFIPNGSPLTIIGANNSGKSNLLKAVRLVLDHQLPHWERRLSEDDFSWGLGDRVWEDGEEIVITLTLSAINSGEESNEFIQSLVSRSLGEEDNVQFNANISFVFGPEFKHKSGIYNIYEDYRSFLVVGKYHPSGFEYDVSGKRVDYTEKIKSQYNGLVKEDLSNFYKYFYLDNEIIERIKEKDFIESEGIESKYAYGIYTSKIKKRINVLYLDALRDVTQNFFDGYNSIVSQLLRLKIGLDDKNDKEFYDELTTGFNMLRNNELIDTSGKNAIDKSKQIIDDTESTLSSKDLNLLGSKANLKIGTPKITNRTISRYFNFLTDLLEENKQGVDIATLGLGYQNLAYISSIFAIFELKKRLETNDESLDSNKIFFNLLLTEEPESHLDVQNQKHLHTEIENKTRNLQINKTREDEENEPNTFTQVIQTSHSTHLTSKAKLENIVVLEKQSNTVIAINVDSAIESDNPNYKHDRRIVHQYLDATRSAMLFAKKVILVEGASEEYALPAIVDYYFKEKQISSHDEGLEIINIGFKGFQSFYSMYGDENKLNNVCVGLTDGDLHTKDDINGELDFKQIYNQYNSRSISYGSNVHERKNIYTFEIDTFMIPDLEDFSNNNIEWLKAILARLHEEGKYMSDKDSYDKKIKYIDSFYELLKKQKLNNKSKSDADPAQESLKVFFSTVLTREISKPVISLYLASLIKAKHFSDWREVDSWNSDILNGLEDFIIPTFLFDTFKLVDSSVEIK